jgi:hypothetical protein
VNYPGMVPSEGTLLSFSPHAGVVGFSDGANQWTLPMIGWAVVVYYIEQMGDTGQWEYDTKLLPVVLNEEAVALPLDAYIEGQNCPNARWRVIL